MAKPKIIVAIPAYNCEKQISRVINGFDKHLLDRLYEVIVIDDRGGDKTAQVAYQAIKKNNFGNKIKVVQNIKNLGLGGTHKMAFLYAENKKADFVVILHGDDQAKTIELNNLIEQIEKDNDLGAVLGCRFTKGSILKGYSWERIWGNKVINLIYSVVALRKSLDLGSGLNLFRLKDLNDHRYLGFDDRMTFNIDLLLDYYTKKTKLMFYPITWEEADQVTNARNFTVAKTALKQLFLWRIGKLKFKRQPTSKYRSNIYKPTNNDA